MSRIRIPPIDVPMAIAALGLVAIGLAMVYSATSGPGAHQGLWVKQLVWAGFAVVAAVIVAAIHYRVYDTLAYPVYAIGLLLLVLVPLIGSSAYGAQRWLDIGPIKFQPSELAKIGTVLAIARRLDDRNLDLNRVRYWLPPVLLGAMPFLLVLKQPDLGTSLTFPVLVVALLYWAGMPLRKLLLALSPVLNIGLFFLTHALWPFGVLLVAMLAFIRPRITVLVAVLAVNVGVSAGLPQLWDQVPDYQKRRIQTFVNPGTEPSGAGYQIIQSKIAIGSGGIAGKGFLKGTQKGLAFLPMRHTDFIYSVVGEEAGLIGALVVMILYAVVILRGLRLARVSRNPFPSLLAVGMVTALFYHVMINMLMAIGWAPVTGLPLPLLSYGGTALIVNAIQIGLLQSVALRRREF